MLLLVTHFIDKGTHHGSLENSSIQILSMMQETWFTRTPKVKLYIASTQVAIEPRYCVALSRIHASCDHAVDAEKYTR